MLSRPHGPSGLGTDEADALSTGKVYKVAHVSPRHPGRRVSLRVRLAPRRRKFQEERGGVIVQRYIYNNHACLFFTDTVYFPNQQLLGTKTSTACTHSYM